MKRLLLACTILFWLSGLPAISLRLSNSIGQDRGERTGEGSFYLAHLPNQTQLHGPEGLVWTKQLFESEEEQILVTRYADGTADTIEVFSNSLLMRVQTEENVTYYQYAPDGRLMQATTIINGRLSEARLYSYSNDSLASIITIAENMSEVRTFGMFKDQAYFAFSDKDGGQLFTTLANGRTIGEYWIGDEKQEQVSVTTYEDGGFSILRKSGEVQTLEEYDGSALLVSVKTPSYLVEYRYNEHRTVIEERITQADDRVTIKTYDEGKLVVSTEAFGGRVVKKTRYNEDGSSVQTLYSEGNPYADVTYAVDGKRVLSISYY